VRRLLVAAAVLALGLPAHGASLQIVRREAASSCTATGITFWWRAENSTTLDASLDYTAGDNAANTNGSPSFDLSAAKNGSYGVLIDASSERYVFQPVSNDIISGSSGRMGAWVKCVSTYPSNGTTGPTVLQERSTDTNNPRVEINFHGNTTTTRKFRGAFYDGTNTVEVVGADNSISCGTWYFVELAWDASQTSGADQLYLYVDGTLVDSDTAATLTPFTANGTPSSTGFHVGDRSGIIVGSGYYIDHIIVSSDKTKSLYDCANTASYP
jgi:hypothetical protein